MPRIVHSAIPRRIKDLRKKARLIHTQPRREDEEETGNTHNPKPKATLYESDPEALESSHSAGRPV